MHMINASHPPTNVYNRLSSAQIKGVFWSRVVFSMFILVLLLISCITFLELSKLHKRQQQFVCIYFSSRVECESMKIDVPLKLTTLGPYNSIMSFPSPARITILDPHCQTDNLKIIHYFGETHLKSCFHP